MSHPVEKPGVFRSGGEMLPMVGLIILFALIFYGLPVLFFLRRHR